MSRVVFITHPEVALDPAVPVPDWTLSEKGFARMRRLLERPWISGIRHIASSAERKARDAAGILAGHLGLPVRVIEDLGENDRSATGYLPKAEFEATADAFFACPERSIRGWERAVDAQARIVRAVEAALAGTEGDTAILAHGGVGALLLCHLGGQPISRAADQPGEGGGNLFAFGREDRRLISGWQRMEEARLGE
ncbi:histidine phosphatase family protein [Roseomonas sp. M0104]|uniref:Histidine phosphatase family protein n=1 Tax=Teichococcus coralli TaxID=2545983 RepID=A0A845BEQ6_9PROT|nr:histidine phosphatase family protein [Pseudoroseomonas coralli]MXP64590.1 histidine phosphatase family protein [Pseudoroseomonas coralli]